MSGPTLAQVWRLLAAVDDLPPAHDCPGLAECDDHPRWRVHKYTAHSRMWFAVAPGKTWVFAPMYGTHAVALDYATSRARTEQLAAIHSSEGTDALPTDLETP